MNVEKVVTLKVRLDSTEQFDTNHAWKENLRFRVTFLVIRVEEGYFTEVKASGQQLSGTTGKPGRRHINTEWWSLRGQPLNAPKKILEVARAAIELAGAGL